MKICILCKEKFDGSNWKCPVCNAVPEFINKCPVFSNELNAPAAGFEAEYFAQLASLERNNFWFCARNNLILWAIRRYFVNVHNFFDIGCGTGFVLSAIEKEFPDISLFGSDLYMEGLNFAKDRLRNTTLLQMDARKIPFDDEFDVIGAFDILEHIKDDELVLAQMYSATHKGGGIILTVPQHSFLWSQFDVAACHVRRYSSKELQSKVADAGFHIVDSISFSSLLFPLMVASRFKKKVHSDKYDIIADLNITGVAGAVSKRVLDFERYLISLGMRLPFGGSLLLIARKI